MTRLQVCLGSGHLAVYPYTRSLMQVVTTSALLRKPPYYCAAANNAKGAKSRYFLNIHFGTLLAPP